MTATNSLTGNNNKFEAAKFGKRVKGMLKLDFYRLFHTPIFYIMLGVAAIIPAMILTMGGAAGSGGETAMVIDNAWQLIASGGGIKGAGGMAGFATIDMVFIFAGLLMAIFVSHDYSSGFVKNVFTVHSKKEDYIIGKSVIGIFGGICMIVTYVVGTIIAGLITSKSFDINAGSLILCLLSKMSMMIAFCSLFLAVAIFFKEKLWLTIIATFLGGMLLYSAASVANLDANFLVFMLSLLGSALLGAFISFVSRLFLSKRDLV